MSRCLLGGYAATVLALACVVHSAAAHASLSAGNEALTGFAAGAAAEYARFMRVTSSARGVVLATKAANDSQRRARQIGTARGQAPLIAVTAPAAGQAGYVHYFLLRLPDETLEIQVGIEMADQRIAWSFPDLGPVVSPFIEAGIVQAGGKEYEVWHLYGLRPFPDDAAMAALQKALPGRVRSLTERNISYCENDGPQRRCMSCLGFVLRALFPGRNNAYPDVPRDFWRAGTASRYTTRDLLLYLSGMLDLPTRDARLKRIGRLDVPDLLREDLEALVYSMSPAEAPVAKAGDTVQKRSGARTASAGARNAPRKKL